MPGNPDAAAAAAEAQQDLRALVNGLKSLSGSLSSNPGGPSGGGGDRAHQARRARKLRRLVRLLQPYVAGDAVAARPGAPSELASVYNAAHCKECALDALLSLLARAVAPLPSALLRDAVVKLHKDFTDNTIFAGPRFFCHACMCLAHLSMVLQTMVWVSAGLALSGECVLGTA